MIYFLRYTTCDVVHGRLDCYTFEDNHPVEQLLLQHTCLQGLREGTGNLPGLMSQHWLKQNDQFSSFCPDLTIGQSLTCSSNKFISWGKKWENSRISRESGPPNTLISYRGEKKSWSHMHFLPIFSITNINEEFQEFLLWFRRLRMQHCLSENMGSIPGLASVG